MSSTKYANAANATPVLLRKGPCQIGEYHLTNLAVAARYVKLFDAAAAADVTVGTTKPDLIIPIAAGAVAWAEACARFDLGVVAVTVTGLTDSDNTAGSARDVAGTINIGMPGEC